MVLNCGREEKEEGLFALRDKFLFEQLMAEPPLPVLYVQMAAFTESLRSARFDWGKFGEMYRAACGKGGGEFVQKAGAEELGVTAALCGRRFSELIRQADNGRRPGHPAHLDTTMFIMGVTGTYMRAGYGEPKPRDLAEIAMVWGISEGRRPVVVRQWNSRAEEYRGRLNAGELLLIQ